MPMLALFVCLVFVAWLLVRDVRRRPKLSAAVWVPTILILVLGSRAISLWLSSGGSVIYETGKARIDMGNDAAGSLVDQVFFFSILAGSFLIAQSRRFKWTKLFSGNTAVVLFYAYFAASILWSGDPIGSLKRLTKDFGLLFVISILFSESDPLQAMRAVYVRCAAVLLPLSLVLIKYFPNYSRIYDVEGEIQITGVTTQKNTLGELVLICMLFLFWDFLETWWVERKKRRTSFPWDQVALFTVGFWLLLMSQSKTALLCLVIGIVLIARRGWLASRAVSSAILAGALSLPFLLFFSRQFASVIAPIVESLGRNMTFTGRAAIWDHITLNTVNPLIGAGYWSFWGGPGGFAINQAMKTTVPNAHNGYLDIYIDGGFIGLTLLFLMLTVSGRRIVNKLGLTDCFANRYMLFRFAFLIVAICYNLSESQFARMTMMWFSTLLMMVAFPINVRTAKVAAAITPSEATVQGQEAGVFAS
ncbi:MAG: O-antigen ligase family protein [Terracidiphilus sp.]|jgi:O-antigen ligase